MTRTTLALWEAAEMPKSYGPEAPPQASSSVEDEMELERPEAFQEHRGNYWGARGADDEEGEDQARYRHSPKGRRRSDMLIPREALGRETALPTYQPAALRNAKTPIKNETGRLMRLPGVALLMAMAGVLRR
jgi:hypothetical protein